MKQPPNRGIRGHDKMGVDIWLPAVRHTQKAWHTDSGAWDSTISPWTIEKGTEKSGMNKAKIKSLLIARDDKLLKLSIGTWDFMLHLVHL